MSREVRLVARPQSIPTPGGFTLARPTDPTPDHAKSSSATTLAAGPSGAAAAVTDGRWRVYVNRPLAP